MKIISRPACAVWSRDKSTKFFPDKVIEVESPGNFYWRSRKATFEVAVNLAIKIASNPTRSLELTADLPSASASWISGAVADTTPFVIKLNDQEKGFCFSEVQKMWTIAMKKTLSKSKISISFPKTHHNLLSECGFWEKIIWFWISDLIWKFYC